MFTSALSTSILAILLFAIAVLCYLALVQRTRIKNQKTSNTREQTAIAEFASLMMCRDNIGDILWDLMNSCISKLGFTDAVVYLYDKEKNVLIQKAAFGNKSPRLYEILSPIEIPYGMGIVGSAAKNRQPELIADTLKDVRYIRDDRARYSELAVPICCGDELIGVIDSEHPQRNFFNSHHLRMLTHLATLCASRISKLRETSGRNIYYTRLHNLMERTPDFIVVSDPTGKCLYANKSYLDFFGFKFNPIEKEQPAMVLDHEQYFEFIEQTKNISKRNPSVSFFKQSFGINGKSQWTHWNETGVMDERGVLLEVVSVGRDISGLKNAWQIPDEQAMAQRT